MKIVLKYMLLVFAAALFAFCTKQENPKPEPEDPAKEQEQKLLMKANKFVYDYTTEAYLWSKHIPDGINYMSAPDPVSLFDMMIYKELDKWSYVTDNSKEAMDSFQGVSTTFGYSLVFGRFSNAQDQYFAVVQYVYPNSPAQKSGLKRGDFILSLGGSTLNASNYTQLYYGSTITIGLGERNAEGAIGMSGKTVTMSAVKMYEDPVVTHKVIEAGGKKIGYLFYAGFYEASHEKLAEVFQGFKSAGVTELILDLRYNPGGDAKTPSWLASFIAPESVVKGKKVFLTQTWNDLYMDYYKSQGADLNTYFHPEVPVNLNLNTVYVLATSSTASASEATIAGLMPYMNVVKIGSDTYGKYCGAALLTATDLQGNPVEELANWLLTLVIYKFVNTEGYTEFRDGIPTDYEVEDSGLVNGIQLGDVNDPMIAKAISLITGAQVKSVESACSGLDGVEMLPHLVENPMRGGMVHFFETL